MPELTQDLIKKIENTHDQVITIKAVLLGANGQKGLCDDVRCQGGRIRHIEIILGIILGGGGLIGGGIGLVSWLSGG